MPGAPAGPLRLAGSVPVGLTASKLRTAGTACPAGKHETSSIHDFSWGVANRGCSIRVGRMVPVEKCGYYEDRRPASNLDPYVVTRLICESALLM